MAQFKRSESTDRIIDHLRQQDHGTLVKYKTLTDVAGEAVDARTPGLRTARTVLTKQHGAVWICVQPNVGVQRLTDAEIVARTQPWFIKGAARKLHRGRTDAENADYSKLTLKEQAQMAIAMLQIESAVNSLSQSTRRKLENIAAKGNFNDLPRFNIAELAGALSIKKQ